MNMGLTNPEQRNGYLFAGKVTVDESGDGSIDIHGGDFTDKAVLVGLVQIGAVTSAVDVTAPAYNSTTKVTSFVLSGDNKAVFHYSIFIFADGIPTNSHLNYPNKQDY